ncbi:MAG: response regulator, partial [Spirochaetota bacterium]
MRTSILIVEDEALIAMELAMIMEAKGYSIAGTAASGDDAIRIAADKKPDIVLMDITIQGTMDGIASAGEICRLYDIPVVFVSAYCDINTIKSIISSCSYGFVRKPYDEGTLLYAVEMALSRHRQQRRHEEDRRLLSSILSSIDDGVIALDGNGVFTFINDSAVKMTGWPLDQLVGKKFTDILTMARTQPDGGCTDGISDMIGECFLLTSRSGEERYVQLRCFPAKNAAVSGTVYVLHDATEKIDAEKKIRNQYYQIREQYE